MRLYHFAAAKYYSIMKNWSCNLFYIFNFLAALLFAFFIVLPIWNIICVELDTHSSKTQYRWYEFLILLVWETYSIFCLKKIVDYLRHPSDDKKIYFIFYIIYIIPVLLINFLLAIIGFIIGFDFIGAQ